MNDTPSDAPSSSPGEQPVAKPAVAPATGAAPGAPERPPLMPVTLIFPGRAHSQMWLFLWFGLAYVVGALLPWDGYLTRTQVLLEAPGKSSMAIDSPAGGVPTSVLPLGEYEMQRRQGKVVPQAAAITESDTMGLGRFLILLGGLATSIMGAASIFTRRLSLGALVATWFLALVVVWFHQGYDFSGTRGIANVKFVEQFGAMFGAVFGNFDGLLGSGLPSDAVATLSRMGIGWYVVALAQVIILVVVLVSLFTGGKKPAPAADPKARGKGARR